MKTEEKKTKVSGRMSTHFLNVVLYMDIIYLKCSADLSTIYRTMTNFIC